MNDTEQRRLVGYLDGLAGQAARLQRLQTETAAALDALLPSIRLSVQLSPYSSVGRAISPRS